MSTRRVPLLDLAIAGGVTVMLIAIGLVKGHPLTGTALLGYLSLTVGGLALVLRRRWPVAVLVVTALSAAGYRLLDFDVPAVAFLFAVYAAVRFGRRTSAIVAAVTLLLGLPVVAMAWMPASEAFSQIRDILEIGWLIGAGGAGEALRQAERRADEAERTREEAAMRRADEERLHIARELHDSLTHQIAVIKVQAEVAVHLARKRGEDVPPAVLAIRDAGREADRELRSTLSALRDEHPPARGLQDVPRLVESARATGLAATLTVNGTRADVPGAVERTAYRIVQESLTNVTRHAAATSADVRIDYRPGALAVRVEDDGTASADAPLVPGVGLLGMRERVTALGGRLLAAPRAEGGFRVQAELPVEEP